MENIHTTDWCCYIEDNPIKISAGNNVIVNKPNISTECENSGYDIKSSCKGCLPGYNIEQNCSECLPEFDPEQNCSECLKPGYDPEQNCSECLKPGYDPDKNCLVCLQGHDPDKNCSECMFGFDTGSECIQCIANKFWTGSYKYVNHPDVATNWHPFDCQLTFAGDRCTEIQGLHAIVFIHLLLKHCIFMLT